jgi:hypothetical protein
MSTFIHDPGGLPYKIEQLYAFISTDEFGSEGVIGFATNGVFMPLVGADMDRVESLRPIAQHVANQTQKQVRLCRFHQLEELEQINPK